MAKTEIIERPAFPLTLAAKRREAEALILRALGESASGNFAGRLPGESPAKLPELRPGPQAGELGRPLDIRQVAILVGCSPWTVRQTLIRRGLPHFRSGANGRLIFYQDQVVRWIKNQQEKRRK